VEQTEEITVKAILKSNDIQPLEEGLRFLVAPRKREYHESDALFFDSSAIARHTRERRRRHCQFFIAQSSTYSAVLTLSQSYLLKIY
jgi:hypothetical protein